MGPRSRFGLTALLAGMTGLKIHIAHAAHAAAGHSAWHAAGFLLRTVGDHGFRRDQERGNRGRVLQRGAHDLGRVHDAGVDEVDIGFLLCVPAERGRLLLQKLADDDGGFRAGVLHDLADRRLDRLTDDRDAGRLVFVLAGQPLKSLRGVEKRRAAARNDAFFNGRFRGVERVVHAVLLFLHFDFGRAADADDRNAAGELRQTFLQLLLVVVRGGFLDLRLDLRHAGLDVVLLAGAVDDRGVVLVDLHRLGRAQHVQLHVLELDAEIFADHLTAGYDGDVFQHRFAAIAKARRLHGRNLQAAAQLVDTRV